MVSLETIMGLKIAIKVKKYYININIRSATNYTCIAPSPHDNV